MKTNKKSIKIDEIFSVTKSQAIIDGKLSPPASNPEIASILLVDGKTYVSTSEMIEGKVLLDGKATITVIYIGDDEKIYSFDSETSYKHTIALDGANHTMKCTLKSSIKDIDYSLLDSTNISIKSIVEIELKPYSTMTKNLISNINREDIMQKQSKEDIYYLAKKQSDSLNYKSDIRIPQNMPQARSVLYSNYTPKLKNIIKDGNKCVLEGELTVYMVYLSNDDVSPLHYLYETLEFGKIIYIEELEDNDKLDCESQVSNFTSYLTDEDNDIINIEAQIDFSVLIMKKNEVSYVEDSYSLTKRLNVEKEKQEVKELVAKGQMKSIIRTSVEIPEDMPTIARVLFLNVKPMISSGYCDQDRVYIEGIMIYNACYSSVQGTKSIKGEFPYTTQVQINGFTDDIEPEIIVDVEYINFDGAGRNIDLKITLCISAKGYKTHELCIVTSIEELDEKVKPISGLHIYFAQTDETYWDIAKKYNTSIDKIQKHNKEETEIRGVNNKKIIVF